jgi:hypothetical protein
MIRKFAREVEQRLIEAAWEESRRAYDLARWRQVVVEWIEYHERLAGSFRIHVARHERERERYQRVLAKETGDTEEVCPR